MDNSPGGADGRVASGDQPQATDALRRSEERYRALVEATSQAVWSWTPGGGADDFARSQRWWAELTGQSPDDQGQTPTAWLDVVHPDDRAAAAAAWGDALAAGVPYDVEYRVQARAGGWRHVQARGVPIPGPGGAVREWVGTLDDVTARRAADDARRDGEERLRLALDAGGMGVWEWDIVTGRITWSDRVAAFYGMRPGEFDGTFATFARHLHPADADRAAAAIRASVDEGAPYRIEYRIVPTGGGVRWVSTAGRVVRDAAGRPLRMIGATTDVTERKRADENLRASEERYRVLANATSDVAYRMSPDWAEMQPLDGRHLVASNSAPVRDWMDTNIPRSEHARVRGAIAAAIATGQTFELEHRVVRADGTPGWTFSRAVPIRDAAGAVVEWFGTARDVTDQKRAHDDLARVTAESDRRKRLYETVLSATPDLVYVFDLDHRFTYANEALLRMWGRSWDDAIGKTCLELGYEPWHAAMHDREIEQVKATRRPVRGEVPFDGAHGRRIYDYIFVPVAGAAGEVEAVAGTTRDVTERKGMEDALRETDRKKDDFIALLAHELRNPLAPIRNGLQVIRLSQDRATRDRSQKMMDRQLGHMVRLIDDLLDVSRIGRNKMELRRARVSLADVVGSAVETARPAVEEAGHELTVALPAHPVHLDADLTRLSQVLSNLLTNSAKYTERGGRIWLSAAVADGGGRAADEGGRGGPSSPFVLPPSSPAAVVVSVRDTGIGIPADALPTIFDMFAQVDRPTERSAGGLGIGLALVKGLVEMHGGTVAAHSGGPGRGSEFTVTLPTAAEQPARAGPAPDDGPSGRGPKRRVLVVDDNRDGAASLAMMLELVGDEVAVAHDGLEAVERAEQFRPEVVLMDVGMPKLDGLEATRRIRAHPWGERIAVIALTGWGQDADRERSRAAGCDGHLVKPVSLTDLEKMLAEVRPTG